MSKKVNTVVTPHIKALEKLLINKPKIKPKKRNTIDNSKSSSLITPPLQQLKQQFINEQKNQNYQALISQQLTQIDKSGSTLFNKENKEMTEKIQQEIDDTSNSVKKMDFKSSINVKNRQQDVHKKHPLESKLISLEEKLSLSPFAAMLASPMRTCTFHRKPFPSDLLMRFSVGIHPTSKKQWGYPSMYESNGRGYYVKLNEKIIDELSKKEYKRLFRGSAEFPKMGMSKYVHDLLVKRIEDQMEKILPSLVTLNLKENETMTSNHSKWKYAGTTNTIKTNSPLYKHGFHCIIILSHTQPPTVMSTFSHSIEDHSHNGKNTPFLSLDIREQTWHPILELLKNKVPFDHFKPLAVAVPKTKETLPLMIDLWRLNLYSAKGKSFIINKLTNE
ncbi:unnamed protein product [Cunninghamella blakesleeana]